MTTEFGFPQSVSRSRDGTVVVEDVALLEIARSVLEAAHGAPDDHTRLRRATQALREGLAQ